MTKEKKNNQIITVDLNEIIAIAEEGGKIALEPSSKDSVIRMMRIQKAVDDAVEIMKEYIEDALTKIDPNYKGIIADGVRITRKEYGAVYGFDKSIPIVSVNRFLKTKTTHSVDTKAVKEYLKEHGELPEGIYENNREAKLSISLIEDE